MQLLKLVIFDISIELGAVHGIGVVLVRHRAVFSCIRVPGGYHAFAYNASMVGNRAIIVCVVSGKTPATNLPQGAVVLIVVRRILVAFKAI
jgi:hypothetical protein